MGIFSVALNWGVDGNILKKEEPSLARQLFFNGWRFNNPCRPFRREPELPVFLAQGSRPLKIRWSRP
jgi:hypothetical protein